MAGVLLSAVLLLLLLNIFKRAASLHIELEPADIKCIGQELDQEDTAIFIVGANSEFKKKTTNQKLALVITDPEGVAIVNERVIVGNRPKEYKKSVQARGVYEMCFELSGGKYPVRVFFHVDFKSRSAEMIEDIKKISKSDIPSLELQLKLAEDLLTEVTKEIDFARRQETALKVAGESTMARIQWFSILSIGILSFTSIWQIIFLRRYFSDKKLL